MNLQPLTGGLSNTIYLLEGKSIIRLYGPSRGGLIDTKTELRIMKYLSALGITPKILLEFDGGRLEEYIDDSRQMDQSDIWNDKIRNQFISEVKLLHDTEINDLDKEPSLIKNLNDWTEKAKLANQYNEFNKLFSIKDKLINKLNKFKTKTCGIGLCHNDLQKTNILIADGKINLIDFEYAGYNFIEFDLVHFLWELNFDITNNNFKHESIDNEFCKKICIEYMNNDEYKGQKLYENVCFMMFFCHYLWIMWAIIKANQNGSDFDYIGYAFFRLNLMEKLI